MGMFPTSPLLIVGWVPRMSKASFYVLDASALLCLLFSEKGADKVEAAMTGAKISAVNYAEVLSKLSDQGMGVDEAIADLAELDLTVMPVTQAIAEQASRLRASTKSAGLSIGDCSCLAVAVHLEAPILTTNKEWRGVSKAAGVKVELAR